MQRGGALLKTFPTQGQNLGAHTQSRRAQTANHVRECIETVRQCVFAALQRSANELDSTSTEKLNWPTSAGEGKNLSDLIQQIDTGVHLLQPCH